MRARSSAASAVRREPSASAVARVSAREACSRGKLGGLLLAADFFRAGGLELLLDLTDARGLRVGHAAGLLEGGERVAAALLEAGERGCGLGGGLLQGFALLAECVELLLQFDELRV